ncbi:unnamed protein product, partial [Durusdinium trenchii]
AQDEFAALAQGRLQRMKSREEPEGNQNAEPEPEEDLDDDPVPGPQKKPPRVTNKPGMMQTLDEAGEIVQDIYNFMLEELMDIVATDPHGAEKKLSTKLGQYAGSNQVVQNILALSNFKNGAFEGPVSWSSFGKQIREANETINSLKTEVRRLPNARGAGRPFGTKNRKRACDATTAKASKKQRTKAEEKGKGDEDEEAEPMDPDEPNEDASSNKTVNKSQSINLHTKCMIVEYALDAQEKGEVASVEKHVMEKFKKYFYSVEKNRFKTGLLSKWVESYHREEWGKIPWDHMTVSDRHSIKQVCKKKWIVRFMKKWQWSYQNSNTKGAFLATTSIEMEEMRKAHRMQRAMLGVDWRLVLNFDQLWKGSYDPAKRVLHKLKHRNAVKDNLRPDDASKLKAIKEMVTAEALQNMSYPSGSRASKLRKGVPRTDFVVGGRQGVTAVTSTWANGEIGPLGVCVRNGSLTPGEVEELNSSYHGQVFVFFSGNAESHFMSADTTLSYLRHLVAPAARLHTK